MSFEVKKKTFLMNSQYINQHKQSTVETVTATSNMFFKQKSEIKHMHTMGVVLVKICVYLLDILWPRQHDRGHTEPFNEPIQNCSWAGIDLLKLRASIPVHPPFLSQCKGRTGHILILRLTFTTIMWQSLGSNSCSLICSQTRCRLRYQILPV